VEPTRVGQAVPVPSSEMSTRPGGRAAREGQSGWRARVRATPGGALFLKIGTLALGVAFIALGGALVVLPGPLTIPPVLLGLYILASEFDWADRLLQRAKRSAQEAWAQAKRRPVTSTITTVGGLLLAGAVIWAVGRYELVDRGRELVGL
jgi:hypothetical protein